MLGYARDDIQHHVRRPGGVVQHTFGAHAVTYNVTFGGCPGYSALQTVDLQNGKKRKTLSYTPSAVCTTLLISAVLSSPAGYGHHPTKPQYVSVEVHDLETVVPDSFPSFIYPGQLVRFEAVRTGLDVGTFTHVGTFNGSVVPTWKTDPTRVVIKLTGPAVAENTSMTVAFRAF